MTLLWFTCFIYCLASFVVQVGTEAFGVHGAVLAVLGAWCLERAVKRS